VRTILLPFTGGTIPRRALDAALRLARAENATLMPAFLATVPRHLPLDAAVPLQCGHGMPLLEAIEQIAARAEVPVDARVARGRTYRHALERLLAEERVDRVIVPTSGNPRNGLSGDDLVWLLERAPTPRTAYACPATWSAATFESIGSSTTNDVAWCGSDSTHTRPPLASTKPRTIARPSPEPRWPVRSFPER
jgi:hypothetical protein